MLNRREGWRIIAGQLRRPSERNFGTERLRDLGDLVVFGAYDYTVDTRCSSRSVDRVPDQRFPSEEPDVLARNPFGSSPRWDEP